MDKKLILKDYIFKGGVNGQYGVYGSVLELYIV